ncbi:probable membrane-associated kinase regulator 6 [Coffea arabica]|uniref:Probable membrane-associated kinase regulator 6 n=1 Tax=Coffea arabica TaxID=13443 RepID=A0A6P6VKX8_COFAR|nr:probable membrane-associated kinase regulator 6 [Coffea arabica]
MESSSPASLSIESFSHSWLMNLKPSSFESGLDYKSSCSTSFDASDEASFIEMDPKMPPSRRFSRVPKDFSFDFRNSPAPLTLADAEDLISADGFLMPLFGNRPVIMSDEGTHESSSSPAFIVSSLNDKEAVRSSSRVRCSSLRRCKRLSKRIFQKYMDFLRPLCQKLRGHRSGSSRVASVSSSRGCENEGKNAEFYSPATSPRTSVAWSADNWRRSCDSESSIYEAVLHCKRTHHGK